MNTGRILFSLALVGFVVAPLSTPFRQIVEPATWAWTSDDAGRLQHLTRNTLVLTFGTLAAALPLGTLLAGLLFRASFGVRRFLSWLLAVVLFVPLPILVSSWQVLLGGHGWLALDFLRAEPQRMWATGMGAAIWIHAVAATPWVAFIVGVGLSWVEPELEDEAAQRVRPWRVFLFVTLPRARASILAAALFVILQTAGEITVADMMVIPTLAEEAHTQFALDRDGLGRTLALALPGLVVVWLVVLGVVARLEKTLPPLMPATRAHRALELGPARLRSVAAILLLVVLLLPLGSLVWRLGLGGTPVEWSFTTALSFLRTEARLLGGDLLATLGVALCTGFAVAGAALVGCTLARDCRWFRWLLFSVVAFAWVMPGSVVGIGLKDLILLTLDHGPDGFWKVWTANLLWNGPSPLPMAWAQAIRAFPVTVLFLWPIVRMIPRETLDEASLAGAGAWGQWLGIIVPLTWRAALLAALVATALCLGEVAASTRAETPGWESFTKLVFDRMHYGVDNNVSALCVLMLASLGAVALTWLAAMALARLVWR